MNARQSGASAPQLWHVQGRDLQLDNAKVRSAQAPFKLLLQVQGHTSLHLNGRPLQVGPGEMTLMDGSACVEVEAKGAHEQWLVVLPRQPLLQRHRDLRRHVGRLLVDEPEAVLIKEFVLAMGRQVDRLGATTQTVALGALGSLLGTLRHGGNGWRRSGDSDLLSHAKTRIDADLADIEPEDLALALRISRRYLDKLFEAEGTTASRYIWQRRLVVAAQDLSAYPERPVVEVAFGLGFKDASHFSKAFAQAHGCSPSAWRARGVA